MTSGAQPAASAEEQPVALTTDLEREVLETLDVFDSEIYVAIDEYEASCSDEGKQPTGSDPLGLTYRDARTMQGAASGLETRVRRLAQRYREDIIEAREEAAKRAQEPFTGRERAMLRHAITVYGEDLTKEAKRLQVMSRDAEARTLLSDAAVLLERVRPLFEEQHVLKGDNGPLFAGGRARVTNVEGPGVDGGDAGDDEDDDGEDDGE